MDHADLETAARETLTEIGVISDVEGIPAINRFERAAPEMRTYVASAPT